MPTGPPYNKQFKRASQRLAFLVLLQIKCLWHNALGLGGSVAHPLIGRYVLKGNSYFLVSEWLSKLLKNMIILLIFVVLHVQIDHEINWRNAECLKQLMYLTNLLG